MNRNPGLRALVPTVLGDGVLELRDARLLPRMPFQNGIYSFGSCILGRDAHDRRRDGCDHRTELGDHVYRFEEIRPGELATESHPHFLCTICGAVSCLNHVKLTAESLRECGEVGEISEILLRGRCTKCKPPAESGSP